MPAALTCWIHQFSFDTKLDNIWAVQFLPGRLFGNSRCCWYWCWWEATRLRWITPPMSVTGRAFLGCTTITGVDKKVSLFISRPLTSTPASSSATFAAKATWTARASSLTAGSCTASSSRARPSSSGDPNPGSPKPALRRPSRLTFQLTSRPRRN